MKKKFVQINDAYQNTINIGDACTLQDEFFGGRKLEEYDGNCNYTNFEKQCGRTTLKMYIFHK